MTDNEIIKALEEMEGFASLNNGSRIALHNAVYLINRQKAEIERLQGTVEMYEEERKYHFEMSKQKVAEAIKEFAERMKQRSYTNNYCQDVVLVDSIDNLVKELTERKEDEGK